MNSVNESIWISSIVSGEFQTRFRSAHKSSKKLLEQCQKLDKIWGHIFSAVITLTTPEAWYRKLRELIDRQQQGLLWMSQTKVKICSNVLKVLLAPCMIDNTA